MSGLPGLRLPCWLRRAGSPAAGASDSASSVPRARAAAALPRPGLVHGAYPQRSLQHIPLWLDVADRLGSGLSLQRFAQGGSERFLAELENEAASKSDRALSLSERAALASRRLVREGFTAGSLAQAQRLAADAIEQALGKRAYRTQHLAAFALMGDRLVELDTGEGKSLAILLAACCAALARVPVHVITSNEYLAERDAEAAQRVLALMGLSAGAIRQEMTPDERRDMYARELVYVTAQEVGFDFLRDRLQANQSRGRPSVLPVLRGLCMALIDEADSVLLDHAKTPLVLAEAVAQQVPHAALQEVWRFAANLRDGGDFLMQGRDRGIQLNPHVLERLPESIWELLPKPRDGRVAGELLRYALTARHVLKRDVDYVVQKDEVVLIDPNTGRTLPGTVWTRSLHSMVCTKEGVPPPVDSRASIQITLQVLFARYLKLGGISGTVCEARVPLWLFHRLGVKRIEPRVPSRRLDLGLSLFSCRAEQYQAISQRLRELKAAQRPVLVGTDSVAAADALSAHLTAAGIAHQLLTARDNQEEAQRVAAAGAPGMVTVATNIAGRGTDIPLPPESLAAGGLHVICCARNGSARIDRQLFGRSARNGQPGSSEILVSLEDNAFALALPSWLLGLAARFADGQGRIPRWAGSHALARWVRWTRAVSDVLRGWQMTQHDRMTRESLGFAPRAE